MGGKEGGLSGIRNLTNSTLLRFFIPLFIITSAGLFLSIFFITERAKKHLYELKAQESLAILRNVMEIVSEYQRSISDYRHHAIESRKEELFHIVQSAISVIKLFHEKELSGEMSEGEAKKRVIEILSGMRYGNNDYIWAIDENYQLLIHPDPKLKNRNLYDLRDVYGVYVIRELVNSAKSAGEGKPGYVFYHWPRYINGRRTEPLPKISAAVFFKPWKWTVGTGVYITDIEAQVEMKKEEAREKLRKRLSQMRIGKYGYAFVFDRQGNIIYHPVLENVNIVDAGLKDPGTGRLMFDELTEVAQKPWGENMLEYLWDRPDDPRNYIYPKIAWCAQEPLTGWYIAISAYKEEIEAPIKSLVKGILFPSVLTTGALTVSLLLVLMRLLSPVREMVEVCRKIEKGDLSAQAPENAYGEIGFLAKQFNKMIKSLKTYQEKLEEKVKERTKELLQKTKELEEANERLKELDQAKSAFLSSVSHELRTPLTSVLGFAKLIEKDFRKFFLPLAEDEKRKKKAKKILENAEIIVREGERLTRLINDVLDLTKIESGKIEWKDSVFSLKELVEDSANSVKGQFAQKPSVRFIVDIKDDVLVKADRDRLQQVIINLLNNAAKFTDEGYVKLSARREDDKNILISVEDTGCGIPPDEVDKVFDKFHQVVRGDTLKDKPKGTGLGLSICKQIVEHYGGKIWVESELGKGSVFYVRLPIVVGEEKKEPTERTEEEKAVKKEIGEAGEVEKEKGKAPLVLVVDDDEGVRKLLSEIFSDEGFEVLTAKNGKVALSLARRRKPDLITMDIMMPEMDGKTAIKIIKNDPELSDIPILVISVLPYKDGADAYLEKPVDQKLLVSTAKSLIEGKRSQGKCIVVFDKKEDEAKNLPVVLCSGDVSYCGKDEIVERIKKGFKGTIIIPSKLCGEINIEEISKIDGVQVVIF